MAILLMNLRNVPEDEADEVRALLRAHGIDFYETEPGRWRLSAGAIWLRAHEQAGQARSLLDDYQERRLAQARAELETRRARGEVETIRQRFAREPLRMLIYLAAIALILYLAMTPLRMLLN